MVKRHSPHNLDYFNPSSRAKVHTKEPILSSNSLSWQHFNFACFHYDTYELPTHKISSHTILISLSSCLKQIRIANEHYECHKRFGFLTILPAHMDFWASWTGQFKFIVLSIKPYKLASFAQETINPDRVELLPLANTSSPDHLITGIALAVQKYLMENPQDNDLYIEHLENALYSYLLQKYCSLTYAFQSYDGLPPYKLKLTLDYIHTNLSQKIRIIDLANLVDISPGYFGRLFRESTGTSPYKYILQQRLSKAQKLLRQTNLPLSHVAAESGFSSQSKMNQYFRSNFQITPKRYRDSQ